MLRRHQLQKQAQMEQKGTLCTLWPTSQYKQLPGRMRGLPACLRGRQDPLIVILLIHATLQVSRRAF